MQNDEACHRKVELAELTNEPWCLPSLESSRAHGVGPSTISHRDHHFEEPKHQAQWHDFRSTAHARLQDRSQRANGTVSLCVVVASASTANFREGSKNDGSRLSVTSPVYLRLRTYFCVAANRRSEPILLQKDFAQLCAQDRFKIRRQCAMLIRKSIRCDLIVAYSYSTASPRRLLQQNRPTPDIASHDHGFRNLRHTGSAFRQCVRKSLAVSSQVNTSDRVQVTPRLPHQSRP